MAQYIIPAAAMIVVAIIEAIAAYERNQTKKDQEARAAHERAREELMVKMVQCSWASIALCESTAHAMQRGHTNGDMEKALDYAADVKHDLKEFLAKQGIHAILD